jgi:hypothetical protein
MQRRSASVAGVASKCGMSKTSAGPWLLVGVAAAVFDDDDEEEEEEEDKAAAPSRRRRVGGALCDDDDEGTRNAAAAAAVARCCRGVREEAAVAVRAPGRKGIGLNDMRGDWLGLHTCMYIYC